MKISEFEALSMKQQETIINEKGTLIDGEVTYEGHMDFYKLEDFHVKMEFEHVNLVEIKAFEDMPAQY